MQRNPQPFTLRDGYAISAGAGAGRPASVGAFERKKNVNSDVVYDEDSSTSLPRTTATYPEEEEAGTSVPEDTEPPQQRSPKTEKNNQSSTLTRTDNDRKSTHPPAKTTKSSTLKGWIEDTWLRPPAALLVPLRAVAINRAMAVWRDLTAEGLNVSDIIVIGFDSKVAVPWDNRDKGGRWTVKIDNFISICLRRDNAGTSVRGERPVVVAEVLSTYIVLHDLHAARCAFCGLPTVAVSTCGTDGLRLAGVAQENPMQTELNWWRMKEGSNNKHTIPTSWHETIDGYEESEREICKECSMWKSVVSVYPSAKQV
ncbi:hypothetical protein EVAR_86860_1 [Eumeta japonica]|uniref:Uncharacterized protein n=1 Tax=Eumeta variegata TaxID=151549 RepID=A0A4C1VTR4_EUMVA|nr:hypothetical protein EVAR_86860_1 [Eumeta japonica]